MTQRKSYLTIPQAAAILGMPRSTAYDAVKLSGHLFGVRPIPHRGNRVVLSRAQIERVARGEQDAPPMLPWDVTTR